MINHYLVEGAKGGPPLSAATGAPDMTAQLHLRRGADGE